MVNTREEKIAKWFKMWIDKTYLGIEDIFCFDAYYIESYGPRYKGLDNIKKWFEDWNKENDVLVWDIKDFFHEDDKTVVLWYFKCLLKNEEYVEFDGVSYIEFDGNKIKFLKEYGCKLNEDN